MAVNDGAVMQAWAKNQKTGLSVSERFFIGSFCFRYCFLYIPIYWGQMLSFMGDPNSKLTKALVSTMSFFQFETIASASGLGIINVF